MVLGGLGGFGREASTPDCQTLGIPDLNLGSRLSLLEYAPDTIAGAVFSFVTVSLTCEAAGGGESWSGEGAAALTLLQHTPCNVYEHRRKKRQSCIQALLPITAPPGVQACQTVDNIDR